jgi:hypothetical protein
LLFEELVFPVALAFLPYMMRKEKRKEGRGPGKSFSSKTASHSGFKSWNTNLPIWIVKGLFSIRPM